MTKLLAYDLEIAALIEEGATIFDKRPLGITCAAAAWQTDDGNMLTDVWHGWQRTEGDFFESPSPHMTKGECISMVKALVAAVQNGYILLTHNGTSFDWRVTAEESGMHSECVQLAMNSVDTCLMVMCLKGYPVGLDAIAKGVNLQGKTPGVNGALAPQMWHEGQYDTVLQYVQQDVRTTLEVALAIEHHRAIRWISRAGRLNTVDVDRLLTVREAMLLPLPDVSWMQNPMPREHFCAWMEARQPD